MTREKRKKAILGNKWEGRVVYPASLWWNFESLKIMKNNLLKWLLNKGWISQTSQRKTICLKKFSSSLAGKDWTQAMHQEKWKKSMARQSLDSRNKTRQAIRTHFKFPHKLYSQVSPQERLKENMYDNVQ